MYANHFLIDLKVLGFCFNLSTISRIYIIKSS